LNAFLANIETLHSEYKQSEETCFDPFERLISSIYHHNITLHDRNVTKKLDYLLQLVDFRSVKSVFQSAVLDFLHKNVTRKVANANLTTMIENLAARVASLKHAIQNVLQVILPQLLQELRDEYKNIFKHQLHIVDLLTAHFLPQSNSEQNNENDLVYYAIDNFVYSLTDRFVYEELNTTYTDLINAIYSRQSAGQISLYNKTVLRTVDELLQHFILKKAQTTIACNESCSRRSHSAVETTRTPSERRSTTDKCLQQQSAHRRQLCARQHRRSQDLLHGHEDQTHGPECRLQLVGVLQ
jgi:hypothetical protein